MLEKNPNGDKNPNDPACAKASAGRQIPMSKQFPMSKNPKFDLGERTASYGENIIKFCHSLCRNGIDDSLVRQLLRAGTSIGANYMEADGALSKQDFRYKIALCRKEAKETQYWLRLVATAFPAKKSHLYPLWQEAQELTNIFSAIIRPKR